MLDRNGLSRREFLKLSSAGMGGLLLGSWRSRWTQSYAGAEHLGRVTEGAVDVYARPDIDSAKITTLYEDAVFPWLREVVGRNPYRFIQRFIETPQGYVWAPAIQQVYDLPNEPVSELMPTSLGPGMWVEVSVPYVDVTLENAQPISPWLKYRMEEEGRSPRLYYSQIIWVDQINQDANGRVFYRLAERYGYGDVFWGPAEAFRPILPEELSPISPDVENKRIDVNLSRQTVSCFEDDREVFFCRASTGQVGEETETPPGLNHRVWRKMVSAHMAGGTARGGYDTPAIGFATYFVGSGVAFHSTFWHNAFGERRSHGCVNVKPEHSKWIFRWTQPHTPYDPGDVTVTDFTGTRIQVLD